MTLLLVQHNAKLKSKRNLAVPEIKFCYLILVYVFLANIYSTLRVGVWRIRIKCSIKINNVIHLPFEFATDFLFSLNFAFQIILVFKIFLLNSDKHPIFFIIPHLIYNILLFEIANSNCSIVSLNYFTIF